MLQGHHPGWSLNVSLILSLGFCVCVCDSAAQRGHGVHTLPSGLLLRRLLIHRQMQTLDQVSNHAEARGPDQSQQFWVEGRSSVLG